MSAPPEELLEPSDLCRVTSLRGSGCRGVALQAFLFLLGEAGSISWQSGRVALFSGRIPRVSHPTLSGGTQAAGHVGEEKVRCTQQFIE